MSTFALPVLSSNGSLEQYIQTVNSIPMLTQEEEIELATRHQQHEDLEAAKRLVMSHLRVVVSIARGYAGYGLPQADLIQEGNIGLMKAVKRFEPNRGVRLFSFAVHWIKAEMHEFILRNWRLVRIATTKPQRKLFFNLRSMKKSFAALSDSEARAIAEDLGVKPEEVREMETRMSGQDVSLLADDNDDDAYAPIDWLADAHNEPTVTLERRAVDRLQSEGLLEALSTLDPRSRRIIEARWLADDSGATLHDLAAEFGVSAERIRQIEAKALGKMKTALHSGVVIDG
ncbi:MULTISPECIES: RNA polymerase sigma factor RpoH [Vogesella]|jgi:RNA polymerase sigma-32 factor|uniref:RNA polymerase sigma factor RpoH n=1 Tax=Vogesella indigofera TaxID=45465 RepID=A0A495AXC2_VOGIN|nr:MULTISPECIES: RNA polymerase sigma factor RpoH [Vogesella]KMJ52306.1 RNA polymerase factor sigma-32 [Vogesella sp. EB]MCQ4145846.1 RNA polymerase sigma factor RpoH [Vogesella sp. AC12]MDC7691789.1 RNA polymerase sigma factor RpoH [Vogesella indigofera]MDC7698776.1 RNA polymerase sigma factor RpoH [Vogesella indigofera]MDC7711586.1 RNA polymerase sigma factor RpoH [Vogesella indigofera]